MSSTPANRPLDPLLRSAQDSVVVDVDLLYREHRQRLLGLAAAITLDRTIAEEVVHDAFVGLQRHAASVENPVGYLQRSVVNIGVNRIRRRSVARRHPLPHSPLAASSPEIDEAWGSVARLPARQRAVVVLRYWHDMHVDAIAETLGWPAGSVKSTLHRALNRLKEDLK